MAAIETPGTGSGSAPPSPRGSQQQDDTGAAPTSEAGRRAGRTQPDDTGAAPTSEAGRRAGRTPVPKLRSRKEGAAIALDDLDKRLLNLMQGQFPIASRPYQHVAAAAGLQEAEVLTRVQHLLDERIIRQVTPIFDTRALGYASMLVAAKVDAENPWRAANIINAHPGVSHNYLRSHEFNIWFTIATEPDSPLGLEGTLEVLARLAGAESVRQLPTLKLFKIRMDLEMEAGTEALAKVAEAAAPAETEAQPYDDFDRAVIRATQGDMPVVPEPYAPAAAKLGIGVEQLLEHLRGMQERRLLRRVAAILFHRRAGFSANGMGVWKVPDEQIMELGMRMASFRGISHCYERPTYADWPYSVFTMAHGRSKEECDAILDSIAADTGIEERATLYSSTEFKKIRLLYFTEDYRAWEREHAGV
jgi:siroheme decarboxylase